MVDVSIVLLKITGVSPYVDFMYFATVTNKKMSKWFFIPNILSLYICAFPLRLCRKRLTWSNRYLEVIFHALDIFSIIFTTNYVEVKNRLLHRRRIVCFGYVHVLPEVRKSSKQQSKTIKVIYLLSIEQLILYLAQSNP